MGLTGGTLFERAFRGEPVERTPVWAMRQAGRWDPEFQKLRAGKSFYEFSENAELAARASLCPLRFGVDAIILFYDITTLAIAMGQKFELVAEKGPVPHRPIRTLADVQTLTANPDPTAYEYLLKTIDIVRAELPPEIPILCFAGAPFTLATYQTGIGKKLAALRQFISQSETVWNQLLEVTANATIDFLHQLLKRRGAAAYQLFDSWAGLLTREEYERHCQPHHRTVFDAVGGMSILFVVDHPYVDLAATSGATGLSLGKNHDLAAIAARYPQLAVQGNVDHELLIDGTPDEVRTATQACLAAGAGHRHILNLDHGMDRRAKPENFQAFVEAARLA